MVTRRQARETQTIAPIVCRLPINFVITFLSLGTIGVAWSVEEDMPEWAVREQNTRLLFLHPTLPAHTQSYPETSEPIRANG